MRENEGWIMILYVSRSQIWSSSRNYLHIYPEKNSKNGGEEGRDLRNFYISIKMKIFNYKRCGK
jgi:hypothetical protein